MDRLKKLWQDARFREVFVYGLTGAITTGINYGVYFVGTRGIAALLGIAPDHALLIPPVKIVAWCASVAFAFWANKKYVFRSASWDRQTLRHELPSFVSARLLSLGFDTAFVELSVVLLGMNDLIATLIANVIVIILNYFASKFWIFKKRDSKKREGKR